MNTTEIGKWAEDQAAEFIVATGYSIIERNYRYKQMGEIDIIAKHNDTVVFVEVRYRTNSKFSPPEASLLPSKLKHLRRTALMWLTLHTQSPPPCRFDVVAIDKNEGRVEIRHLVNAF